MSPLSVPFPPSNWDDGNYTVHSACMIWFRNINKFKVNFQTGTEAITQLELRC